MAALASTGHWHHSDGGNVYKGDRGPMGFRPDEIEAAITEYFACN